MFLAEVYNFCKHLKQLLTLTDSSMLSLAKCHMKLEPRVFIKDNDEYSVNHNFWWSYVPFLMYLLQQFMILCKFQSPSL